MANIYDQLLDAFKTGNAPNFNETLLGVDIRARNDLLIKTLCKNGTFHLLGWLFDLAKLLGTPYELDLMLNDLLIGMDDESINQFIKYMSDYTISCEKILKAKQNVIGELKIIEAVNKKKQKVINELKIIGQINKSKQNVINELISKNKIVNESKNNEEYVMMNALDARKRTIKLIIKDIGYSIQKSICENKHVCEYGLQQRQFKYYDELEHILVFHHYLFVK
jgi:hypothetical protein